MGTMNGEPLDTSGCVGLVQPGRGSIRDHRQRSHPAQALVPMVWLAARFGWSCVRQRDLLDAGPFGRQGKGKGSRLLHPVLLTDSSYGI